MKNARITVNLAFLFEKNSMEKENNFEVLSGREQILRRPQMWLSSCDPLSKDFFVIEDGKATLKTITYIPAVRKIIDEVLDNAIDVLVKHSNSTGNVKVRMTDESVYVEDDGIGIPVAKKSRAEITDTTLSEAEIEKITSIYIPEHAWTRIFSGSNFQDSENKTTIGNHGVGSVATNIFSKKFVGHTDDGKKACTVTSTNNMEKTVTKVEKSCGKSGTWVEFYPDLERFKINKIEKVYHDLTYQRLICLAITFPKIKFHFNGKKISVNDKTFLSMFSEHIEFQNFSKGFVGIFPNESDEFNFLTYVNGLSLTRGGTHVDFIVNQIVAPIRDKLCKKYKSLKPADIRNKFTAVVFLRDFPNTKFDSQTKETLTNSVSDVSKYLGNSIDFEKFAKQILKNEAIINPIIDMFKLKEELKSRQELKQSKKAKVRSDKYMAPIGEKKYLFLCEGQSATSSLCSCIGRNGCGFYSLRGLPINTLDNSIQKIAANQEFKDVMNILELDVTKDSKDVKISFDKIVIATDQDLDGIHLSSMLIGWFKRFAPNLFNEGKICKLQTPLIIIKDNKDNIKDYFFDLDSFRKWEEKNKNSKLHIIYQKGLGSIERSDINWLLSQQGGLDKLLYQFQADAEAFKNVDLWLTGDSEQRKEKLRQYTLDINLV